MFETKRTSNKSYTGNKVQDIQVLLERVLQKNHITEDMNFKTISERFSEVVGPLLVDHVKPEKIDKNIFEMNLQKKAIIGKCNALLGKPFIQGIRFV